MKEKLNLLPGNIDDTFFLEITKEYDRWVLSYDSNYNTLSGKDKYDICFFSDEDFEKVLEKTIKWLIKNKYI